MNGDLRCPSCGFRLRKLGLEEIYACDGTQTTVYWKFVPTLVPCARNGYPLTGNGHPAVKR